MAERKRLLRLVGINKHRIRSSPCRTRRDRISHFYFPVWVFACPVYMYILRSNSILAVVEDIVTVFWSLVVEGIMIPSVVTFCFVLSLSFPGVLQFLDHLSFLKNKQFDFCFRYILYACVCFFFFLCVLGVIVLAWIVGSFMMKRGTLSSDSFTVVYVPLKLRRAGTGSATGQPHPTCPPPWHTQHGTDLALCNLSATVSPQSPRHDRTSAVKIL